MDVPESESVLLVEAFYGGSHKQFVDSLEILLRNAGHGVCVVTLPPTKWHWRARTGALALSGLIPGGRHFRVLFTSSVFSLAELLALRPDLAAIPRKVVYFHENQLAYPLRQALGATASRPDYQFAYNQIITALVADQILFNSAFNMHSFYEKVPAFLASGLPTPPSPRIPDPRSLVSTMLSPKSTILPFLVDLPPFLSSAAFRADAVRAQAARIRARAGQCLRIVWNHRWDYDKNPVDFFRVIFELAGIVKDEEFFRRGTDVNRPTLCHTAPSLAELSSSLVHPNFSVSVLGSATHDTPVIFTAAETLLRAAGCVSSWGFLESREAYWRVLGEADVVVSTADHEFFGVSVVEAVAAGCMPLLPNRLSYPELLYTPPQQQDGTRPQWSCTYATLPQLKRSLKRFIGAPARLRDRCAEALLAAHGLGCGVAAGEPWFKPEVTSRETVERQYLEIFKE